MYDMAIMCLIYGIITVYGECMDVYSDHPYFNDVFGSQRIDLHFLGFDRFPTIPHLSHRPCTGKKSRLELSKREASETTRYTLVMTNIAMVSMAHL